MLDEPLEVALAIGVAGLCLELVGVLFRSRIIRRLSYLGVTVFTAFAAVTIMAYELKLVTVLVSVVAAFRIFNAMRVIEERMKEPRLYFSTKRTSLFLILFQVLSILVWWGTKNITHLQALVGLLIVSTFGSLVILLSVKRNLAKSTIRPSDKYVPDTEMPTVSVCIPARNETEDLPACLNSILDNDYPKLEVLVLDDCSQDKTSEIIKSFAKEGVRFIAGDKTKQGWLAKNQAYEGLADAASGEILLFCGVDTRFDKQAIRALALSMKARKKQMISVLPKGILNNEHASLVQPMRYWWDIALPRRIFNRPPVLSTVWAISRQAFLSKGGIGAVKNSVMPEAYFARVLTKTDEYSFMRASDKLMIKSRKHLREQWQTAMRLRYPQVKQRPENVIVVLIGVLWILALPMALFLVGFVINIGLIWLLAGINSIILIYAHHLVISSWHSKDTGLFLALFPVAILTEIVIGLTSMWRYEFGQIKWKDRDVCIPSLQTFSKLPEV